MAGPGTHSRRSTAVQDIRDQGGCTTLGHPYRGEIGDGRASTGKAVTGTVKELIELYEREIESIKPIGRTKLSSLGILKRGLATVKVRDLDADTIILFARKRAKEGAGPVTVGIDLSYLGTALRTARALMGLSVSDEPVRKARAALDMVGLVGRSGKRDRRPTKDELERLFSYWSSNGRMRIPMVDLTQFAIATGMRLSEICRIERRDLRAGDRTILIRERKDPRQKAGNDEVVPLLDVNGYDPIEIIERQPKHSDGIIFPYNPASISNAFAKATEALGIDDLHWHDLRHEAASRLFEAGLQIEQVAMITGHREWSTLKRYTHLKPSDITAAFPVRI